MNDAILKLATRIQLLCRRDRAASVVEYALLIALVAMVCLVAIVYFGNEASESFSESGSSVGASN